MKLSYVKTADERGIHDPARGAEPGINTLRSVFSASQYDLTLVDGLVNIRSHETNLTVVLALSACAYATVRSQASGGVR